jgi:hypothetical protein
MMGAMNLDGYCPVGCGPTLVIGIADPISHDTGRVVCGSPSCPRPGAAGELLADQETEHIVFLGEDDFTLRHPLRERLDDDLMTCELHLLMAKKVLTDVAPGKYRVIAREPTWIWERVD